MIWLTWRQHRLQAMYMVIGLAVLAAGMVPLGVRMHGVFDATGGLAACVRENGNPEFFTMGSDGAQRCHELADAFLSRFGAVQPLAIVLVVLPLLVGLFLGAPLIARELEHGTHRFVWTQGVGRLRWATTKLALLTGFGLLLAAGYAVLLTWWMKPLNVSTGSRLQWLVFDLQGVVPLAYTVFAIALGAAAGVLSRKLLPAMGITLAAFLVVRVLIAWLARPNYLPQVKRRTSVVTEQVPNDLRGDWIISGGVYDANGNLIASGGMICPKSAAAGGGGPGGRCDASHYNVDSIQPGSRFWTFQWIEAGIFTALALGLVVFAVYRVQRRLS